MVSYVGYFHDIVNGYFLLATWLLPGIWLNRKVLPRLIEWHPVYNTLSVVSADKLRFALLWPIYYGRLLFSLAVDRLL